MMSDHLSSTSCFQMFNCCSLVCVFYKIVKLKKLILSNDYRVTLNLILLYATWFALPKIFNSPNYIKI